MLAALPRTLPPLSIMLDDLGRPSAAQVGRALGVTARQVQRWQAVDCAPRPAALALFWLTRWGRSEAETSAHNAATLAAARLASLERENQRLRAAVARLAALPSPGASNGPLFDAEAGPPLRLVQLVQVREDQPLQRQSP